MRAREHVARGHVATIVIASFPHPAGHQLVLGGLFPRLYFIGAASVATPAPPPPLAQAGVGWNLLVAKSPEWSLLCNTRYTASVSAASCFYKRLSRIKWVLVNEVGQCTLSAWRDTPVLRSFFSIHIQVPWTRLSKTATALLVCGMYLQIRGVSVGTVPSMSSEQ